MLVTVAPDGCVARERLNVATSQVHDIRVALDGVDHSGEIRDRVAAALVGLSGTVRVTLEGEVGPEVEVSTAGLADVGGSDLLVVARLGRVDVRYDVDALAEAKTVQGQFVRSLRAAVDLTDEQRRKIMVTGLRALEGRRSDLEVH